jgi:transcriptional regulator GlxA family with amidase domain
MSATVLPPEIGVLAYPDAQLGAIFGLTDLFAVANRMVAERLGAAAPELRVSHWRATPGDPAGEVTRSFDTHPGLPGTPTFLILPPAITAPITPETAAPLAAWLRDRHAEGATLCSVCAGAFLLGEAGVVAGRSVTTHWYYAEAFAERFPDAQVDADRLVIDDGDVITAGGLMAWTDLGLKLVDRLLGPAIMLATARFLLVDPPGREQRYYSLFSPRLHHGDASILKVQHWLQTSAARDAAVPAMAARAGLEERTFLRRFRKATGMTPIEYCQHLRVGKARDLLETSNATVDQIAWSVGYEDPGAFRRVFHKITGLTPRDHRQRFGAQDASPRLSAAV